MSFSDVSLTKCDEQESSSQDDPPDAQSDSNQGTEEESGGISVCREAISFLIGVFWILSCMKTKFRPQIFLF